VVQVALIVRLDHLLDRPPLLDGGGFLLYDDFIRNELMTSLFSVKCFSPSQVFYTCQTELWVEAVAMAHLLAETYGHRANVYKPNEVHHAYSATGNPDITDRIFT